MGGVVFQGVWDAATNTPALVSGVGTQGHYYVVSVAGTTNLDGITDWQVGDWTIFNGTVWQKVDNTEPVAIRIYAPSATDPVAPVPQNGDQYFNTVLAMTMEYDSVRTKWLSIDTATFQFGRNNNNTPAGNYYRGLQGLVLSATRGFTAKFDGTVVALGYTRDDSDAATFEVTEDGNSIATLASSATSGRSTTLNGDFSQDDVLAVRNQAAGNVTTAVSGYFQVKWRV